MVNNPQTDVYSKYPVCWRMGYFLYNKLIAKVRKPKIVEQTYRISVDHKIKQQCRIYCVFTKCLDRTPSPKKKGVAHGKTEKRKHNTEAL